MVKQKGEEMYEKNQRIYFDNIPDVTTIPQVEKIIKGVPLQIPDDLGKKVDGQEALDELVPREARVLINDYKKKV